MAQPGQAWVHPVGCTAKKDTAKFLFFWKFYSILLHINILWINTHLLVHIQCNIDLWIKSWRCPQWLRLKTWNSFIHNYPTQWFTPFWNISSMFPSSPTSLLGKTLDYNSELYPRTKNPSQTGYQVTTLELLSNHHPGLVHRLLSCIGLEKLWHWGSKTATLHWQGRMLNLERVTGTMDKGDFHYRNGECPNIKRDCPMDMKLKVKLLHWVS